MGEVLTWKRLEGKIDKLLTIHQICQTFNSAIKVLCYTVRNYVARYTKFLYHRTLYVRMYS